MIVLGLDPSSRKSPMELQLEQYQKVLADADAAISLGEDTLEAHELRAAALCAMRRDAEAQEERQKVVALFHEDVKRGKIGARH